jgi:hypothetical protein
VLKRELVVLKRRKNQFKCTDAYFADDYQWITLDITDSDFQRVAAEVAIDDAEILLDHDEQRYVIKRLVEDVLGGYIESDFFEWDEKWIEYD